MNKASLVVLVVFAIIAAFAMGAMLQCSMSEREAVAHDKAEYYTDNNGNTQWRWKP